LPWCIIFIKIKPGERFTTMSLSYDSSEEIINFPVPKRFLPLVIQCLAKAMEEPSTATSAEPPKPGIDWTNPENMRKLRKGLESLTIGLVLMDLTSRRPDQEVAFDAIWKAAGFATGQQARSSLGAFTKVIKRDFKVSRDDARWPVSIRYGMDGVAIYQMDAEVAKAWNESGAERSNI
jgi:hypothetical protein